ncbi:MAG: VanW family protein [Oscillospiraceae bacterium]|nr:VanW family protein [Oscillospiraceae bacterium]
MNSINLNIKWSKRKIITLSTISLIIIALIIGFYRIVLFVNSWDNLIYKGVYIKNIDVSGMSKEKALMIINLSYVDKVKDKDVNLNFQNLQYYLKLKRLGLKSDVDAAVENAFQYGKDFSLIGKLKAIIKPQRVDFDFQIKLDNSSLNSELNDILKDIYKEPVNAQLKISGNNFTITPHEDGRIVDKDELSRRITTYINDYKDEAINIEVPVKVVKPKIDDSTLKQINGIISSFTTNLGNSTEGRIKNIEKGVSAVNGTILLPGEVFSFNDTVGDTSQERGFFPAPEIIHGKLEQGFGGGICQVSSTLYGAILRANIIPIQRQHHSFPVNYISPGLDATIVYGVVDFKFKNIYDFPIYIKGSVADQYVTFSIYSDVSALKGKTYQYYCTNKKIIPAKSIYVNDPTLWSGIYETRVIPRDGIICDIYRITYDKNGNILEDKFIYRDTYSPIDEIVAVGTRKR